MTDTQNNSNKISITVPLNEVQEVGLATEIGYKVIDALSSDWEVRMSKGGQPTKSFEIQVGREYQR